MLPDETPSGVPEVRAVRRAIEILRAFDPSRRLWSLSELSRRCGLDKGTVRRILHTLRLCGLVEFYPATQSYELTFGLMELAAATHRGTDLQTYARPILSDLAEAVDGSAFLWVMERSEGICLDRVCAPNSILTNVITAGNRCTLNCGAAPRVLLAYCSAEERAAALARPQTMRTVHSVTDPAALEDIASAIRARGYEYVADDFIIGLAALGVPILSQSGGLLGAISITNLTDRIRLENGTPMLLDIMLAAARRLAFAPPPTLPS